MPSVFRQTHSLQRKAAATTVLLILSLSLLSGCSSSPSESAARDWFQGTLRSQVRAPFEISNFTVLGGELTVLGGVSSYRMSYEADVFFPQGNQVDCLLKLCLQGSFPPTSPKSLVRFRGELVFQKAENTWVVARDWSRPPQATSARIDADLTCDDLTSVVRMAAQGRSVRITQMSSTEDSRSDTELVCGAHAQLSDGRISDFSTRAYSDGGRVAITISRRVPNGPSGSTSNAVSDGRESRTRIANDYHDRLMALGSAQQRQTLASAIRDNGHRCRGVDNSSYQQEYQSMRMWIAECRAEGRRYAIFLAPDGAVQVRDCANVEELTLPLCQPPPPA